MFENWPNENAISTDPFINGFFFALLVIVPIWRACKRIGLPSYYALPTLIPFVGWIISASLIAFSRWPIEDNLKTELNKGGEDA